MFPPSVRYSSSWHRSLGLHIVAQLVCRATVKSRDRRQHLLCEVDAPRVLPCLLLRMRLGGEDKVGSALHRRARVAEFPRHEVVRKHWVVVTAAAEEHEDVTSVVGSANAHLSHRCVV
ncbi:hypothetical protein Micbo1qcDRAFT_157130, partial [Microdochium bolleyi]